MTALLPHMNSPSGKRPGQSHSKLGLGPKAHAAAFRRSAVCRMDRRMILRPKNAHHFSVLSSMSEIILLVLGFRNIQRESTAGGSSKGPLHRVTIGENHLEDDMFHEMGKVTQGHLGARNIDQAPTGPI